MVRISAGIGELRDGARAVVTNKNKYRQFRRLFFFFCLFLFLCPHLTARAFAPSSSGGQSIHEGITRDALTHIVSDDSLKLIVEANDSQDKAGGEGALECRRHFDGGNLAAALSYIDREKKKALNCAAEADGDVQSRADALRHFGLMLHCVQDFYSRSNYLEIELELPACRANPFDIPLVDWSKLPDGYEGALSGLGLAAARHTDKADEKLNKDSELTPEGKKIVSGKISYYSVARELAVRETQRQWNLFEALIRARCPERSAAVIAALKQAGAEISTASGGSKAPEDN